MLKATISALSSVFSFLDVGKIGTKGICWIAMLLEYSCDDALQVAKETLMDKKPFMLSIDMIVEEVGETRKNS